MIVSEFQFIDELSPREQPCSVDFGAANEDYIFLILANGVVKV